MFDAVPVRAWLLLVILLIAWQPARYIFRHVSASPSRRDITRPADDLSWRTTALLQRNVAILVGLAALGGFIFTPVAEAFARSPRFGPIILLGVGSLVLWSVVTGFRTGSVEPMVRGASWVFTRHEHPRRFWASMAWNGLWAGMMLGIGAYALVDVPRQDLRDRCLDRDDMAPAEAALAACNQLLADASAADRSDALALRGSAHFRLGDYQRAGADYAAALRLNPQDGSSHFNMGLVHERLGQRERALADYGAAIAIDPANAEAFQNRGLIYLDTRRFDLAIADFTRALALDPTNMTMRANRGIAHAWKADAIRAEQDFALVRNTDPSNLVLLHGEALLALDRGDTDGAIRLLDKAIALQPRDDWALFMRAEAFRTAAHHQKMGDDPVPARR